MSLPLSVSAWRLCSARVHQHPSKHEWYEVAGYEEQPACFVQLQKRQAHCNLAVLLLIPTSTTQGHKLGKAAMLQVPPTRVRKPASMSFCMPHESNNTILNTAVPLRLAQQQPRCSATFHTAHALLAQGILLSSTTSQWPSSRGPSLRRARSKHHVTTLNDKHKPPNSQRGCHH